MTATAAIDADEAAMQTPFIQALVRLIRAGDSFGVWENKPDTALIAPFILTKEERRALPMMADPDPDVLDRVELFYNAMSLAIESRTGLIASPMMKVHHEGFGRVVMTTGKLVVLSRHMRDLHRFGFDSIAKLAAEGEKYAAQAVETIEAYPEVARA
ncbi:MAG: NifX-associated nitrogen fixation protein [Alphaproteobacteria bacterium]